MAEKRCKVLVYTGVYQLCQLKNKSQKGSLTTVYGHKIIACMFELA